MLTKELVSFRITKLITIITGKSTHLCLKET